MAHIVILGAGLGGIPMALEMKAHARAEDRITVINKYEKYILKMLGIDKVKQENG